MSLFDYYIMIDWSGAARRTGKRAVTIWIAHGRTDADTPYIESPSSRTEAVHSVRSVLQENLINGLRTLICFDFAYGYPVDFAAALEAAIGKSDPTLPWLLIWKYLSNTIIDDQETAASRKPSNRSNRFEVANDIN